MRIHIHSQRVKALCASRVFQVGLSLLGISQVMYLFNSGFLLPIVIVGLYALFLPAPTFMRSLVGRTVIGLLLFYALYQLIAVLQYWMAPDSGFITASCLLSVVSIGVLVGLGRKPEKLSIVSKQDLLAIAVGLLFIVPLSAYALSGGSATERIASIGSIQGNDGATHFSMLSEAGVKERITYESGAVYYPYGFHLATAFIEDAFSLERDTMQWSSSVKLYIIEYLVLASILSYTVFLLTIGLIRIFGAKTALIGKDIIAALAVGPTLTVFYLLPFLYNGFINYYYICATLIAGILLLLAGLSDTTVKTASTRTSLILIGLLLLFGASSSWPIFAPIILAGIGMYLIPSRIPSMSFRKPTISQVLIVIAILLQLLPLYLQLKFATVSTSEGINATGALKIFHPQFIILALLLIGYISVARDITVRVKQVVLSALMPLLMSVSALALYQYFYLGEIRYYTIKLALFLEILLLIFAAAIFALYVVRSRLQWQYVAITAVAAPLLLFMALFGLNDNPLKDSRDMFRSYSKQAQPAFIQQDTREITEIGATNQLEDFNVVTLHYNQDGTKLFAHPQTTYWANSINFKAKQDDYVAKDCYYKIYTNLLLGTFTQPEQDELIRKTSQCARLAETQGRKFYIVTDDTSAPRLSQLFNGNNVVIK